MMPDCVGEDEVPRGRLRSHISGLEEENEALRAQMDRLAERLRDVESQPVNRIYGWC